MKKLNFKKKIKLLDEGRINEYKLDNKTINLLNIDLKQNKAFQKISKKSKNYIKNSFNSAYELAKNVTNKLINGPISKFLNRKYLGIEYQPKNLIKKNSRC